MLDALQLLVEQLHPHSGQKLHFFSIGKDMLREGSPKSLGVEQPFRTGYNSLQQNMLPFGVLLKGLLKPVTCILQLFPVTCVFPACFQGFAMLVVVWPS